MDLHDEPYKLLIIVDSPHGHMAATTMSFQQLENAETAFNVLNSKVEDPRIMAVRVRRAYEIKA